MIQPSDLHPVAQTLAACAGLILLMLAFLVPILFIGCGRHLCGFFW